MTLFSKNPAIASALLYLAAQLAPLQAQTIHQNADQFFGSTVYSTERREVDLEGASIGPSRSVSFQFVADKPVPNADFPYALVVHTQTPDPILIQRGPSLVLKLDGTETMQLTRSGSASAGEVGTNGQATEGAYYSLMPDMLRKISAAKSVEFRIIGDQQTIAGTWHSDLLADAAAFSAQAPKLLEISTPSPINNSSGPISPVANQSNPVLGVGFTDVPAELGTLMKLDRPRGALVLEVAPGSIANKAGIEAGDVILEFGTTPIVNSDTLRTAVGMMQPGQRVAIKIWRATQSTLDLQF